MTVQAAVMGNQSSIDAAAQWVGGIVSGSLTIAIATIAVGMIGYMMLSGRLAIREGSRVVFGVFLLLGAGTIASSLLNLLPTEHGRTGQMFVTARSQDLPPASPVVEHINPQPAQQTPFDPYAGAAVK